MDLVAHKLINLYSVFHHSLVDKMNTAVVSFIPLSLCLNFHYFVFVSQSPSPPSVAFSLTLLPSTPSISQRRFH